MGEMAVQVTNEDSVVLRRCVDRLCPHWSVGQRDELVSRASAKLLSEHNEVVDGRPRLLRRTAYSVVVGEIRRRRRRCDTGLSASRPGNPIVQCLTALEPDRRRAVTLYLQTHRVPEIASLMRCDLERASNLVKWGLTDLRKALAM